MKVKSESKLGNREYSPSITFYPKVRPKSEEEKGKEQAQYIVDTTKAIMEFAPENVLKFYKGLYSYLVKQTDKKKNVWEWDEQELLDSYFLTLKELLIMLQQDANKP